MVARAASQAGRPLRRSQPRSGWTQITRTRARKLGAMMPEMALSPNVAIVAAASPRRISSPRGRDAAIGGACSLTRDPLLPDVLGESGRGDGADRGGGAVTSPSLWPSPSEACDRPGGYVAQRSARLQAVRPLVGDGRDQPRAEGHQSEGHPDQQVTEMDAP